MENKPVKSLIFGHSHVWSVKRAMVEGGYQAVHPDYEARILLCGTAEFPGSLISYSASGGEMLNPCLLSQLNQNEPLDRARTTLVSMVQGNHYNVIGLVRDGAQFDFVLPGREDLPVLPGAQIIPYGAVRDTIVNEMKELEAFLRRLKRLGFAYVFHVNAPPPIRSSDFILEELRKKGQVEDETIQVTDPFVRLKLWILQKRVLNLIGNRLKMGCFHALPETQDKDGFLRQEFWKDSVHANEKYSAILLRQIENRTLEAVNLEKASA